MQDIGYGFVLVFAFLTLIIGCGALFEWGKRIFNWLHNDLGRPIERAVMNDHQHYH